MFRFNATLFQRGDRGMLLDCGNFGLFRFNSFSMRGLGGGALESWVVVTLGISL